MRTPSPARPSRVQHPVDFDIENTAQWQKIPVRTVSKWTGLAQGTIYNKIREGEFPDHEEKKNPGDRNEWRAGVIMAYIKGGMPAASAWREVFLRGFE